MGNIFVSEPEITASRAPNLKRDIATIAAICKDRWLSWLLDDLCLLV